MNSKPGLLQNIRQQIENRNNGDAPQCPLCAHPLTIERTKYFTTEVCESCLDHVKIEDYATCCDNTNHLRVKMVTAGGTIQVREQCQSCGSVTSNSFGGYDKLSRDKLPDLNKQAKEARGTNYSEIYMAFYKTLNEKRERLRKSRRDQIKDNWFRDYNKYLSSQEWKNKRDKVLQRDNHRCQCCLASYATQVHHKNYEFEDMSGKVPAFDLISVCGPCHEWIEKKKQEKRESENL